MNSVKSVPSCERKVILRQLYETRFGIYNHLSKEAEQNPLSCVALHDTEENSTGSLLYSRIEQYIKSDVHKYTGLNLNEFLAQPREIVQWLFKLCEEQVKKDSAGLAAVQQQLQQMKK